MENAGYLLAAFILIWAALLAYTFIIARKQAKMRRDIELLREQLERGVSKVIASIRLKIKPAASPVSSPPRCACQATPEMNERITKPPITATHRGMGTGMGKIITFVLGTSIASAPPRANTAPEAPIASE